MYKCVIMIICILTVLISGCSGAGSMEMISDNLETVPVAAPAMAHIDFPKDDTFNVTQGEGWCAYSGDAYEVIMQTYPSGDLNRTLKQITGYDQEQLTVMEIPAEQADKYVCAWSTMSEEGELVGRCTVLDDGVYHYCLSVLIDAAEAGTVRDDVDAIFATYSLDVY